jgi:hypothetical protein
VLIEASPEIFCPVLLSENLINDMLARQEVDQDSNDAEGGLGDIEGAEVPAVHAFLEDARNGSEIPTEVLLGQDLYFPLAALHRAMQEPEFVRPLLHKPVNRRDDPGHAIARRAVPAGDPLQLIAQRSHRPLQQAQQEVALVLEVIVEDWLKPVPGKFPRSNALDASLSGHLPTGR